MITLAEELILLAVEDDGSVASTAAAPGFGLAVTCACLVDLSNAGRIDADLQTLRVISKEPMGVAAPDRILEELAAGPAQSIESWLLTMQPQAQEIVGLTLGLLTKRGILEQKDSSFLWVMHSRRYPVIDGREQKEAKLRIISTLLGDDLPTPHDTVMLGLARAAHLLEGFLSSSEVERLEDRMAKVGGIDLFVRAAEDAIRTDTEARARAYMIPMY